MPKPKHPPLLPCPFCTGEARIDVGLHMFVDTHVSCESCGASGPIFGADAQTDPEGVLIAQAVLHWNTRAPIKGTL